MSQSAREIRRSFLEYFKKHGHEVVRSSPLVPANDPTLLFTNAGMVQFKDVFTGREERPYRRATSSQKCVRAGGKHNDLENVGRTARHHTFFEMLGNFSFGDYFKADAIAFAWEWLTKVLALDPKRMVVSVFNGEGGAAPADDEALELWRKVTGFGTERIMRLGMKDNFWMMGDTGPQGPCSEIYYYTGPEAVAPLDKFNEEPTPQGVGWVEIWNLVFMQFQKATKDSPLVPLPKPSIDTGAGLERVSAVVQGVTSNYDTDAFRTLLQQIAGAAKKEYRHGDGDDDVSMRVIADHARATSFLVADGVSPENQGRGYVLRRIMRRAIRHAVRLGLAEGQFRTTCERVISDMREAYPELDEAKALIARTVDNEDQTFRRTLDRGNKLLDEAFTKLPKGATLPGETVFKLYDTYGFPVDLTRVIAEEKGFGVDEAGFDAAMQKQQSLSAEFAGSGEAGVADVHKELEGKLGATRFLGYEATTATAKIVWMRDLPTDQSGGRVELVADQTPFYGESGGQIGDTGKIASDKFEIEVVDTHKTPGGLILHLGRVTRGKPGVGDSAAFTVDDVRRDAIRANHSATHLLHLALKEVLGSHVAQKGSLVAPDRLRFDFAHFQPMTDEEKRRVEDLVNDEIRRNADSVISVMAFDEAKKSGAVALFGEKYGDTVRVMRIGSRSVELCGGTHVRRAGDIGLFKITQESGIQQGVRRIEAVTGAGALDYLRRVEGELGHVAGAMRAAPFESAARVDKLLEELKTQRREIEDLKRKMALGGGGRDLMSSVREVAGMKVLATRADVGDPKALREVADQLRDKLKSGVVVLGGVADGKVALVAAVTSDLTSRVHAGKIIGEIAKLVGGRGGGKPELAQAGGSDAGKLDEALESVYRLIGA
ncbi:MAG TPA: alanine--tRNA ligase [Polyangia bacterium]|nr:alanine--tRNA ligase [Polyangia bacterium]